MKNLHEQYKLLIDDKKYFTSYRESFIKYFLESIPDQLKEDPFVKSLGEKIYSISFSLDNEKTVLDELYVVVYRALENNLNIKPALSKAYLKFLKEYIDHVIETEKNINYIKAFITVIEEYIHTIDRAHLDYIESLKKKIEEIKNEKKKDELKTILTLLKNIKKHNQKIKIISYYKELAILCNGYIKDVSIHTITLDISRCMKKIFQREKHIFLKVGHPSKVIKGRIRELNTVEGILILDEFELINLPQEKRKYIRVRLNKKPKTILKINNSFIEGIIDDISIGGVGLYVENISKIKKGNYIEIKIPIGNYTLIEKGEVIHIHQKGPIYKVGIQFIGLSQKDESILGEFITERQFEILKEIRE